MNQNKIINIYGIAVDRATNQFVVRMRENNPSYIVPAIKQLISDQLDSIYPDGYLIYAHKTKSEFAPSILKKGLFISEEGAGLESTMTKVFDSKSKYPDGDFNYLYNSINTPNQYGSTTILAVFPRKESALFSSYPANYTEILNKRCVSPCYIIGSINSSGEFKAGKFFENNGEILHTLQ